MEVSGSESQPGAGSPDPGRGGRHPGVIRRLAGWVFAGCCVAPAVAGVVLSEIMPADATVCADEDGDHPGWVELHNRGNTPVALDGVGLSDDASQPFKWRLPSMTLAPDQRLVVFTSGKDRREPPPLPALTPEPVPKQIPGLRLWLDAAAAGTLEVEQDGLVRWHDRSGRAYERPVPVPLSPAVMTGVRLWLDAADASTLRWDEEGRLFWQDKSGSAIEAGAVSEGGSPTAEDLGADGRWLAFDGKDDHLELPAEVRVRTLIWLARQEPWAPEFSVLPGGRETYDFHPGESRVLLNPVHAPGWQVWVNGEEVDPYRTVMPGEPSILVLTSTTGGRISLLGSDRLLPDRFWAGTVGEIIGFERELTRAEREGVEAYLRQKWHPPQAGPPAGYDAVQHDRWRQPRVTRDPVSALPAVRFDGEDDCLLFPRIEEVRALFWVATERPVPSGEYPPVVGDMTSFNLHRGPAGTIYHPGWSSPAVASGEVRLDGALVNPLTQALPERRVLVSTLATHAVTAGTIGTGRLLDRYFWGGDIHEVLLFDRGLSEAERERVERYLVAKWRLPDRRLHTNFEIKPGGEWLTLTGPDGVLLDVIPPVAVPAGLSYARGEAAGSGFAYHAEPTPGRENHTGRFSGWLPAPQVEPPGGFVEGPVTVTVSAPGAAAIYYTLDGSEPAAPPGEPVDEAWFDDALPAGALPGPGSPAWIWGGTEVDPYSGSRAVVTPAGSGMRQYSFLLATGGLAVGTGDRLFVHVWLDPALPPSSLLVQWHVEDWEHRAFWGTNPGWPGEAGTAGLYAAGDLPATGGWLRLEVAAGDLGLEGRTVTGMAFGAHGGTARWDLVGRVTFAPGTASRYAGPFLVPPGTVVRARAYGTGLAPSGVVTVPYLAGPPPPLPVIALTVDPADLWSPDGGLYATGPGASRYPPYLGANFHKAWERPAVFSVLETNGLVTYEAGAGVRIHGGYSRSAPQKSFRLYARRRYGPGSFDQPFFPSGEVEQHEVLVLRNTGNDAKGSRLRDRVAQMLGGALGVDHARFQPVAVHLNGAYWGHYDLMERVDEHFVAAHEGWPADALDMVENGGEVVAGDIGEYLRMVAGSQAPGLESEEGLEPLLRQFDPDSFLAYHITEIHLDNTDWPTHNTTLWRPRSPDGQWRWVLNDLDGTFDINRLGADRLTLRIALGLDPEAARTYLPAAVLPEVLKNARFRDRFINRFADALNSVFLPENVVATIDAVEAELAPEMPRHLARWLPEANEFWPVPASVEAWRAEVERLRTFARERPAAMRRQLVEHFGLTGEARVSVATSEPALGRLRVNSLRLPTGTASWEGTYFREVPIEIEALPASGAEFAGWEGLSGAPALLRQAPDADLSLRARFRPTGSGATGPQPFPLRVGEYRFDALDPDTPAGQWPSGMTVWQSSTRDPGLTATFDREWLLPFNLASRSRVMGLRGRGLAFLNTGNAQDSPGAGYLGAAVLALDTRAVRNIRVSWVGGTVEAGERPYGLRLQFRSGTDGPFTDLLNAAGGLVEYQRNITNGDFAVLGSDRLPEGLEGQPLIQLRWVYHRLATGPDQGSRDALRLDDIRVHADPVPPEITWRVDAATGRLEIAATGLYRATGAWVQASDDLSGWTNRQFLPGAWDGQAEARLEPVAGGLSQFYRVWIP